LFVSQRFVPKQVETISQPEERILSSNTDQNDFLVSQSDCKGQDFVNAEKNESYMEEPLFSVTPQFDDLNSDHYELAEFNVNENVIIEEVTEQDLVQKQTLSEPAILQRDETSDGTLIVQSTSNIYECSVCQKQYSQSKILKRHLKTHLPFKHSCDICGKSFAGLN
jgi:hypothetical protein